MTPLSVLLSWFPTLVMLATGICFIWLCYTPSLINIATLIFCLYGFPLAIYHLHNLFYPVKEGISYLRSSDYSSWWGSHQIQLVYIAFPILEIWLRLIPGLFSCWLRLWGSKIGKDVYWMPKLEIGDRSLIEVGDRAIIGHDMGIYSHVIKPKRQNLLLYVKKVKIGNDVFLGSASRIGPGVGIKNGAFIPVNTDLFPNKNVA